MITFGLGEPTFLTWGLGDMGKPGGAVMVGPGVMMVEFVDKPPGEATEETESSMVQFQDDTVKVEFQDKEGVRFE